MALHRGNNTLDRRHNNYDRFSGVTSFSLVRSTPAHEPNGFATPLFGPNQLIDYHPVWGCFVQKRGRVKSSHTFIQVPPTGHVLGKCCKHLASIYVGWEDCVNGKRNKAECGSIDVMATNYKYSFCWQYFDNAKGGGDRGWHPYDFGASDTVEDAYQSWMAMPEVDVRSVYSGSWNYAIDFNLMQQQNKDHFAHTVRKLRRVTVAGKEDAMADAEATQKRIRAQRAAAKLEQNNGEEEGALEKRVSKALEDSSAMLSRRKSKKGFINVDDAKDLQPGDRVRLKDKSVSAYPHYKAEYLGKEGVVGTIKGFPPVYVHFDEGGAFWCVPVDLEKQASLTESTPKTRPPPETKTTTTTTEEAAAEDDDEPEERPFTDHEGKTAIPVPESKRDKHGNASGNEFDLAKDNAFKNHQVYILNLHPHGSYTHFNKALQEKGFEVNQVTTLPDPEALDKALESACQIWLISDQKGHLTDAHCKVIQNHFEDGKGVYIWGDDDFLCTDARYLGKYLFGCSMSGTATGNQVVTEKTKGSSSGFLPHPITTGVEKLFEGYTIATVDASADENMQPLCYGSAGNLVVAYYDDNDQKRAVFDGGFTRLWDNWWDNAGTARYVKNAAAWLVNWDAGINVKRRKSSRTLARLASQNK